MTLTAKRSDTDHVPCVIIWNGRLDGRCGEGVAFNMLTDHENRPTDYTNIIVEGDDMSYIVRRLTPTEAERLQGFPDGWTDIGEWVDSRGKVRKTSDSNRYKALGNSIALPQWDFILKRISATYERPATMASLFDGIGGFPLLWERINGKGSCLWASEIEDFCIAVTSRHFGEENENGTSEEHQDQFGDDQAVAE